MTDPLADIVGLLQPSAPYSKLARAHGAWRVRRTGLTSAQYSLTLSGPVSLAVDDKPPVILTEGDFVLIPAASNVTSSSPDAPPDGVDSPPVQQPDGSFLIGDPQAPMTAQQLIGHCNFASPDAPMLVTLLPEMVLVRGQDRLGMLARLIADETRATRPAREMVVQRLLEVLLIEAFRSAPDAGRIAAPGLLRGMADDRLALALRALHDRPSHGWTVPDLARLAGMSRSAFFARFSREIGLSPMDYLLTWRMTLAKALLRSGAQTIATVAQAVGYGSASAFSTAFARHVGQPPARYALAPLPEGVV